MDEAFKNALFAKAVASLDNAQLGEIMKEAMVAKAGGRGAVNLTPAEIVRDMFLNGDLHKVPTKAELEVGKPVGASGADVEKQVRDYSDFAPQTPNGRTENAEKLEAMFGNLMSSMKAIADGMKALTEITTASIKAKDDEIALAKGEDEEDEDKKKDEPKMEKSLVEQVTKSILVKAEEEDEEEDKEDEMEDEMGKSLSEASKIRFAKALIAGAGEAMKSKDAGRGLRREIEKTVRKAYSLALTASESKEKDVAKLAKSALTEVEEFMFIHDIASKAKKGKKRDDKNQNTWPDHEGMEKSLADMQRQLHGLMNVVENVTQGRGIPKNIEVLGADSPLAKGGQGYFDGKIKLIQEKADTGTLSENDEGAAMEMVSMMQAVTAGQIPETVVKNTVATASAQVRAIFPEWLPGKGA